MDVKFKTSFPRTIFLVLELSFLAKATDPRPRSDLGGYKNISMSSQTDIQAIIAKNVRLEAQLEILESKYASRTKQLEQEVMNLELDKKLSAGRRDDRAPQRAVSAGFEDPAVQAELSRLRGIIAQRDEEISDMRRISQIMDKPYEGKATLEEHQHRREPMHRQMSIPVTDTPEGVSLDSPPRLFGSEYHVPSQGFKPIALLEYPRPSHNSPSPGSRMMSFEGDTILEGDTPSPSLALTGYMRNSPSPSVTQSLAFQPHVPSTGLITKASSLNAASGSTPLAQQTYAQTLQQLRETQRLPRARAYHQPPVTHAKLSAQKEAEERASLGQQQQQLSLKPNRGGGQGNPQGLGHQGGHESQQGRGNPQVRGNPQGGGYQGGRGSHQGRGKQRGQGSRGPRGDQGGHGSVRGQGDQGPRGDRGGHGSLRGCGALGVRGQPRGDVFRGQSGSSKPEKGL